MSKIPAHGTPAGYQRDMKINGSACQACSEANRDYVRAWRIRTGRTGGMNLTTEVMRQLMLTEDLGERRAVLNTLVGPRTVAALLGEPEPEEPVVDVMSPVSQQKG